MNVNLRHLVIALVVLSLVVVGFKDQINDIQSPTDNFVEQVQVRQVNQFFGGGIAINNNKLYNTAVFGGGISLNQGMNTESTLTSKCYAGGLSQSGYTGLYQSCDNPCYYNNQWWCFPSWVDCDTVMYCDGVPQGCSSNYKSCCLYDDKDHVCAPLDLPCDTHYYCGGGDWFCEEGSTGLCCDGNPGCCPPNTNQECYNGKVSCCRDGTHRGPDGMCWPDDMECKDDTHCPEGHICKFRKCRLNEINWEVVVNDATSGKPITGAEVTISGVGTQRTDNTGVAKFIVNYDNVARYIISAEAEGYFSNSISRVVIKNHGWSSISIVPFNCELNDTLDYTCPDGFQTEYCNCQSGEWECIISPENLCIGHGYCSEVDDCPDKEGYTVKCSESICDYEKKGNLIFIGSILGTLVVLGGYFTFKNN